MVISRVFEASKCFNILNDGNVLLHSADDDRSQFFVGVSLLTFFALEIHPRYKRRAVVIRIVS